MSEPFIGEIRAFGFTFAPRGWAFCNGQILPIAQNTALFALLGTTYGGNGQTTFALPNLQGRVPIHQGQGPGLSIYNLGQTGGAETVTLVSAELPTHTHSVKASSSAAASGIATNNFLAVARSNIYAPIGGTAQQMSVTAIAATGGNQPHENRQPCLAVNYCIALQGIFPSRN
jgi:microcystin-dependent protein